MDFFDVTELDEAYEDYQHWYDDDNEDYAYNDKNRINPYTGKPAKFHMDRFFAVDMNPPKLTEDEIEETLDNLEELDNFKRNYEFDAVGKLQAAPELPSAFADRPYIEEIARIAAERQEKLKQYSDEQILRQKRLQRIRLFDNCLRQYLNEECGSNHRIRPPIKFRKVFT